MKPECNMHTLLPPAEEASSETRERDRGLRYLVGKVRASALAGASNRENREVDTISTNIMHMLHMSMHIFVSFLRTPHSLEH
jgi:hypothetical protein